MILEKSFWSPDYITGINVIFDKLKQGVVENGEILSMVQDRISIENNYAISLQNMQNVHEPQKFGFNRDEGASLRQAYVSYLHEMSNQGSIHSKVAAEMDKNIRGPFYAFALNHRKVVNDTYTMLSTKIKDYQKSITQVQKSQSAYYNKCRQLEDTGISSSGGGGGAGGATAGGEKPSSLQRSGTVTERTRRFLSRAMKGEPLDERETGTNENGGSRAEAAGAAAAAAAADKRMSVSLPFSSPSLSSSAFSSSSSASASASAQPYSIDIGNSIMYSPAEIDKIVDAMLKEVPLSKYRIPLWGTYENVTLGTDIVLWLRKRLDCTIARAEKFGQGLIEIGYLKSISQVSPRFVNAENRYQWTDRVVREFLEGKKGQQQQQQQQQQPQQAIATEKETASERKKVEPEETKQASGEQTTNEKQTTHDALPADTTAPVPQIHKHTHSSGTTSRLQKEIADLDTRYQELVIELDRMRCELERTIFDSLRLVEKQELERLHVCKKILRLFAKQMSSPDELKGVQQRLFLHDESISPEGDLRYLVEDYKTSLYTPQVVAYKNFYSSKACQTFGVDLSRVPFIVPIFLRYFETKGNEGEEKKEEEEQREEKEGEEKEDGEKEQEKIDDDNSAENNTVDKPKSSATFSVSCWTTDVPIFDIHQLRNQINDGQPFDASSIFPFFPPQVLTATFKQLLLELPDPLISFTLYDSIRNMYIVQGTVDNKTDLIDNIASKLYQLPQSSIDFLHDIIKYWTTLCSGGDDDDSNINQLSSALSYYVFRPRVRTGLNMKDTHPQRLLKDLLMHGEEIFAQVQQKKSQVRRQRSFSEANRRAAIEARNRELAAASGSGSGTADSRSSASSTPFSSPGTTATVISSQGLIPLTLSPDNASPPDSAKGSSSSTENGGAAAAALGALSPNSVVGNGNGLPSSSSSSSLLRHKKSQSNVSLSPSTAGGSSNGRVSRRASFVLKVKP